MLCIAAWENIQTVVIIQTESATSEWKLADGVKSDSSHPAEAGDFSLIKLNADDI